MTNESLLDLVPIDFGGGSGLSKANIMYYLIKKFRIKASIDIGVYRGRSLLPQANAHKNHTNGVVYGVDPYDNELVREKDNKELKEKIDKFIQENDFEDIYKQVRKLLKKTHLDTNAKILRSTSADAVKYFEKNSIHPRLIHIDGNHDTALVMDDVRQYSRILGENGFIVVDDISWSSVKPAVDFLNNSSDYRLLFCKVSSWNDYAVYTNIKSARKNKKLVSSLYDFGQYE